MCSKPAYASDSVNSTVANVIILKTAIAGTKFFL